MTDRTHRSRRIPLLIVAALALLITVLLQQPAGAPPDNSSPERAETDPSSPAGLHETQARSAARTVWDNHPVVGVEVAVKDGLALIAIKPEPGLSPDEHRALERTIAQQIPGRVRGIDEAYVTTDPGVYDQVRRLDQTRRDLERRVGTRTTESHLLWQREFETVARQMEERPNRAHGESAAVRAHPPDRPRNRDGDHDQKADDGGS